MLDTSADDRLFADFDALRKGMNLPDDAEPIELLPAPRGVLVLDVLGQVWDGVQTVSPFVSMALLVLQYLFNRSLKQKVAVAEVAGVLRACGLSGKEMQFVKQLAASELHRLGLSPAEAEKGAAKVVARLSKELPPAEEEDEAAVRRLLDTVKGLAAALRWEVEERPYGCLVRVPVDPANPGRTHPVHVIARGEDEGGQQVIEFQAVCGEVKPDFENDLLRESGKLAAGTYAIRRIGAKDCFVVQHRLPLADVNTGTLTRTLPYFAVLAHETHARMS